jgi:hypothetical protein
MEERAQELEYAINGDADQRNGSSTSQTMG